MEYLYLFLILQMEVTVKTSVYNIIVLVIVYRSILPASKVFVISIHPVMTGISCSENELWAGE